MAAAGAQSGSTVTRERIAPALTRAGVAARRELILLSTAAGEQIRGGNRPPGAAVVSRPQHEPRAPRETPRRTRPPGAAGTALTRRRS
jgi:hypothetical protein